MVDLCYKNGNPVPNPNPTNENSPKYLSYHIQPHLLPVLDNIKKRINKHDKDYVMLIDGYEGSGKSTFAQQIGKYVDPTLSLKNICMTADEFKKAILHANIGQCVIYDEAVTGMSAGESITRVGRLLKSLMMQMRQKNLFVIVIMPAIFEFSKYAVLSRARSFFHTYEKGDKMGYWVGYSRKDMRLLYIKGKKNHSYSIRSRYIGRFYGKYAVNEEDYRKKKGEALRLIDDDNGLPEYGRIGLERLKFLAVVAHLLKKHENLSQKQVCDRLRGIEVDMTQSNLSKSIVKVGKTGINYEL